MGQTLFWAFLMGLGLWVPGVLLKKFNTRYKEKKKLPGRSEG
jgi:hypothetical protein